MCCQLERCFSDFDEVKSIQFENEDYAFINCEKLTSFNIPKRLKQFNRKMFDNCNNIKEIIIDENNVLFSINKTKLLYCPIALTNDYYLIPNEVENIEYMAFLQSLIEKIIFPNELEKYQIDHFMQIEK